MSIYTENDGLIKTINEMKSIIKKGRRFLIKEFAEF